mgnify:CR=1 FL=1
MLHLIVGNTGSGKTTYSTSLKEETNGIIFSIDKWNNTLFLKDKRATDGIEWFLERIDRSEKMILELIQQLEDSGTDSILDLGFSKFEHRQKFRDFAAKNSFVVKTHFLDITKETRLERVMSRNKLQGSTFEFEVSQEDFDFMETWFEKPTMNEMKDGLTISE